MEKSGPKKLDGWMVFYFGVGSVLPTAGGLLMLLLSIFIKNDDFGFTVGMFGAGAFLGVFAISQEGSEKLKRLRYLVCLCTLTVMVAGFTGFATTAMQYVVIIISDTLIVYWIARWFRAIPKTVVAEHA